MKTARQITVEALCQMEKEDAWSNFVWDSALSQSQLSLQDRTFATALFYGTLTRLLTLNACINEHSNRPVTKMDGVIRGILQIALYQLLYMDSVPQHAAVNEAVGLCRKMKKSSAASMVNAVLRSFLRSNKKLPIPNNAAKSQQWEILYSCPAPLIKKWIASYGEDATQSMLQASLETPPTFLRVNTSKIETPLLKKQLEETGISSDTVDDLPACLRLHSPGQLSALPEFQQGLFHMQDRSSQAAALALVPEKRERILDCCAAPGGKAFVLAQEVGSEGQVVACELHPHRVAEMARRKKQLGLSNMQLETLDMTEFHPQLGFFDKVLCDVPCSGYGTIRRRPEIKYDALDKQKTLPSLQGQLLSQAGKYCKEGGLLVYSTCTLLPEENEKVVQKFLENHPDYQLDSSASSIGETVFLGEQGADGFYIAVLRHTSQQA